jgi:A118 family predicted phage portal protein
MQTALDIWADLYSTDSGDLKLPIAIATEFARLVMAESVITVCGNNEISTQFDEFVTKLRQKMGLACALGGMAFKPYISGNVTKINLISADRFYPVAFDSDGNVTSAVFVDNQTVGENFYTRLEHHEFKGDSYTVTNKCYKSQNSAYLGALCNLSEVESWADIEPSQTIANVEKPLFSYFKIPLPNNIDETSPIGVSVYAQADKLIRQAEEMWERIQWEYQSKETAIDVSVDLFKLEKGKPVLPRGRERLYRMYQSNPDGDFFFKEFSPEIRDTSLFNGFNKILQRIEFSVGLAYGTISEPSEIEKTATEILTSKQRSYVFVSEIQRSLEKALQNLVYAINVYSTLVGGSQVSLNCTFGDSVLEDTEKEFQRRLQMVSAGLLSKEKFVSWYFNCDEKSAIGYIPQSESLFGG